MKDEELAYYRAVEDLFCRLRGTPFILSPKDFAMLRRWWRERVPLAAVVNGIGEVFERRHEREADPVSSLAYCRHAVQRQARRLAEAAVGGARGDAPAPVDARRCLDELISAVLAVARRHEHDQGWAAVLNGLVSALQTVPDGLAGEVLDETLARLEVTSLDALASSGSESSRSQLERAVAQELFGLELEAAVRERTTRAIRRKLIRELVGLPRLECPPDAS
ncbi:MAG: hypothetical protein ACM3O7_10000 [Acidobacteriota bacterium]